MLFPPGLILLIAGVLILIIPNKNSQRLIALAAPVFTLAIIWTIPENTLLSLSWISNDLIILKHDSLGRLFATIFAIMSLIGTIYAIGARMRRKELSSTFFYGGSAVSACLVGDLITLFIFWEIMALASCYIILKGNTQAATAAGKRYIIIHLFGGALFLTGIAGHWIDNESITFQAMALNTPGHWLILAAFLINAGAPPFSSWLPDAYPESSPAGMVFLSAFTTKTAVYAILRGFAGEEVLIYFGLFMVFYGILWALLENDMRRILAYSIVNQVGFMITGAGIGSALAINGATAHAFTHIIYKALLLMSAGAVLQMTGKSKCIELGGLYRTMPLTTMCCIIGALSISAFPLTSGFISKSMITEAASIGHLSIVWYLLAAASAGVFLHAGIKFPWFVFFQKDSGLRPKEPALLMQIAMIIAAILCIIIGIFPSILYKILPGNIDYIPYSGGHVGTQFQLLLFSGLAFFLFLPLMKRTNTITLDLDYIYRRLVPYIANNILYINIKLRPRIKNTWEILISWSLTRLNINNRQTLKTISSVTAGLSAFWVVIILCICLLVYYS
tara:strand:- start:24478 stop:26160 length:1683 start_codon:yes stop_codon:yes gene_type:complete